MSSDSVTALDASRFDVTAADGSPLAVWVEGAGPALVMVHGSIADHTTFDSFVAVLRRALHDVRHGSPRLRRHPRHSPATRSRSTSPTSPPSWMPSRPGPEDRSALWGHSYGANCAMGGAARSANVSHLVLYEPSLGLPVPAGLDRAHRGGARRRRPRRRDRGRARRHPGDDRRRDRRRFAPARCGPCGWRRPPPSPGSAGSSRTGCTDPASSTRSPRRRCCSPARTASRWSTEATQRAAAAIPHAQVHVLDGHGHFAHKTDPAMVTAIVRDFVAS